MGIKFRLMTVNGLQFFIWGSWLLTIGAFWFGNKEWPATDFGLIFSTMGFASLIMPTLAGHLADKFISAQKLYGLLHILGGIGLFFVPMAETPMQMFWTILITMCCYMPTIPLSNTVGYHILKINNLDVIKDFPKIRVWGTIGFIAALWTVSLTHNEQSANQFFLGGSVAFVLGILAFTLPDCPPHGKEQTKDRGNAWALLKSTNFILFFFFSMLLGAALQLTNAYGDPFLSSFSSNPQFTDTLAVKYPAIIMSISQISETLFILAIPFFMKRFNIKQVMLISMAAWVLRFGLFIFGDPGSGLWMIVLSCVVYGMAFDFFNVSGSLFIEQNVDKRVRSRAQGIFTMMVNGVGAVIGSIGSGYLIGTYFTNPDKSLMWQEIWTSFTIYAAIIAVTFALFFRIPNNALEKSTI